MDRRNQSAQMHRIWRTSGYNGRLYDCSRDTTAHGSALSAELNVKDYVYKEIVEAIKKCVPDPGESPPQDYGLIDSTQAYKTKLLCISLTNTDDLKIFQK